MTPQITTFGASKIAAEMFVQFAPELIERQSPSPREPAPISASLPGCIARHSPPKCGASLPEKFTPPKTCVQFAPPSALFHTPRPGSEPANEVPAA